MDQNITNNELPLVAIVIPVYNDENYIRTCLDSIKNQTVTFWEVWLADDCSTDKSAEIMKEYCEADNRFHYIRNETNSSAWVSRAKGILSASPSVKYIMFADADDSIQPNAVERAYELMEKSPVDILNFGTNVENFGNIPQKRIQDYTAYLQPPLVELKGKEIFESFIEHNFEGHLWNKMFNAELLRSVIEKWGAERVLPKAQDKALYWAVCRHKNDLTYRGVEDKLYNYSHGLGVEGKQDALTIEQYRQYLTQSRTEDFISEIMRDNPEDAEEYAEIMEDSRLSLIRNTARSFTRLSSVDKAAGLDLFAEYWTRPLDKAWFSSALAEYTWGTQLELADAVSKSEAFSVTKKGTDIQVIGTYYHRMDNGGIQRVIAQLVPYWHELGYKVVIFTDYPPEENDYEIPEYAERVAIGHSFSKSRRGKYVKRGKNFAQLLSDYHVDCMVYHSYFSDVLLYDMCVCKSLNVPFVIYEHNVFSRFIRYNDARFTTIPAFAGLADGIVCLDDTSAMWWKNFNFNVHTVLNPLTFDLSEVSPSERNNHNILFLCRLNEEAKHPHDAVTIMRDLVKIMPDAKIYVVGSSDDERYMESLNNRIAKLELEENVIMAGFTNDVEKYYKKCSVFLSCSSHEGAPMTLCEALSFSMPIVMYELPYLAVDQDNPGIVTVKQRDTDAAVDELYKLLSNKNRLIATGDKGRKYLEKMYSADIGKQWRSIFDSIGNVRNKVVPSTKMMCDTLIRDYYDGVAQYNELKSELRKKNDELKKKNNELKKKNREIANIHNSLSFKIGRFLTFIPRKIRALLKKA
ncbi:MAG: glycosyltransferase [Ruminococcaceae bacterium]|nr:glycosyltransferase [Oscillospiraceae bacterium]